VGSPHNSYKHQYYVAQHDVEKLENYEVKGIRKYNISDYSDMDVPRESAEKIKKASTTFIEELKKAKVLFTLKNINLKDIANYVDDSVRFCSKVFNTRYFASSAGKPTILDVNEDYNNQLLTTIIWDEDRKNFANAPDSLYQNKEVCISGVVRLVNNKPQIVLRKRDQITVKSPISLAEVPMFVGDSVTVRGKVFSGKYFSNGNNEFMLLNMGAVYPNQLLTVMLEDLDKKNLTGEQLENFYLNKELSVTGKITLFKDKPQVVIHKKDQMEIIAADATASAGTANFTLAAQPAAYVTPKAAAVKDKAAEFPGGLEAFKLFLNKNLQAPSELKVGQQKTVIVQFLIDADGTAKQWQIAQSGGNNFDKEAIRVLKRMPKWVPAWQNGHPMAISVTQPITFVGVSE
jgi:TonB family protein